jgi:hypothetical protein
MAKKDPDSIPQSGKGTNADRGSKSPLEIRRGSADPTDVDDSKLNLDFGERHDYDYYFEPTAPISGSGKEAT